MNIYGIPHEPIQSSFVELAIKLYSQYDEKRKECQKNGGHMNEVYSKGTGMVHCTHCNAFYEKLKTPEEDKVWQEIINTPFDI